MQERSFGEIGSKPTGKGEGWVGQEESALSRLCCVYAVANLCLTLWGPHEL